MAVNNEPIQVQTSSMASPDSDDGGYDCDFVQPPHDDMLCNICHLPARDATLSVCCGQSFCKFCLDSYLKSEVISHSSCPYCHEENLQSVPDRKTARYVLNLQVFCPNKSQGCSWIGELRSMEDHLSKSLTDSSNGCLFIEVYCSNKCGVVIQRRLLEDHLKVECELRQVKCQYCGSEGSYQWINSSHQQECHKYPMECPNHCKVGCLAREEMVVHLEECPLAVVECPFAVVGCDSVVRREERMGHMKEAVGQHVECNKEAISKLIRAKTGLEEQLKAKEQEIADIKNTTENLKRIIDEKGKELDDMRKKAEEREQIMQDSMKQMKEMFEQELRKLREEMNVGVFSNRSFPDYFAGGSIFTEPEEPRPKVEIKPVALEDCEPTVKSKPPENFEPTVEFKPLVELSDVVIHSGEERDMELFSDKAKLYRFEKTENQWKERGVGNIKILKHKNTGRVRILMRRDQVLKICCNHMIVKGMKLIPRDERSFTWMTLGDLSDLSCGEARAEIFTVKFKHASTATAFQEVFNDNAKAAFAPRSPEISIPLLRPSSSASSTPSRGRGKPLKYVLTPFVEPVGMWSCRECHAKNQTSVMQCVKCGTLKKPTSFELPVPSQKENPFYAGGRPVEYSVTMGNSLANSTIYSVVRSDVPPSLVSFTGSHQLDRGNDDKDSGSILSIPSLETLSSIPSFETASTAPSSLFGQFRMPKIVTGEPKNLFPTGGASVGPIPGGLDSIHADSIEGEPHPEAEANIYFDPVVSLPSSFSTTSGEENEESLFTHKAKLFRYDGNLKVWKDRGIGTMKILKNKTSGKGRVLMRREQVLKLCCNHYIVPGMALKTGSLADRSWIWFTLADLSEDTPQEETLCVKFKYAETAAEFKRTFDMFTKTVLKKTLPDLPH